MTLADSPNIKAVLATSAVDRLNENISSTSIPFDLGSLQLVLKRGISQALLEGVKVGGDSKAC
jgi:hypothetical protein